MPVIGLGWPRTGTTSLRHALERLGFGPCGHATTVMQHLDEVSLWERVAHEPSAVHALLERYGSLVDNPVPCFWRAFASEVPEARFVLTVRDPAAWHASYLEAIHHHTFDGTPRSDPRVQAFVDLLQLHWVDGLLGGQPLDRDACVARFEGYVTEVEGALGDRVLRFDPRQGWAPLCTFLGVDVPSEPFPWRNARSFVREHGQHEL